MANITLALEFDNVDDARVVLQLYAVIMRQDLSTSDGHSVYDAVAYLEDVWVDEMERVHPRESPNHYYRILGAEITDKGLVESIDEWYRD